MGHVNKDIGSNKIRMYTSMLTYKSVKMKQPYRRVFAHFLVLPYYHINKESINNTRTN